MDRITEVLTKHGWPPVPLVIMLLLVTALYVLYQDHREMESKWQNLARANLESNLQATAQRRELQKMLEGGMKIQNKHLETINQMDQTRIRQQQMEMQLTASAVEALRQIAAKVDVQLQMSRPEELIQQ